MRLVRHILAVSVCLFVFSSGQAVQIRREPGHRIPEYVIPTDRDNPALWTKPQIMTKAAPPGHYANSSALRTGIIEYPLILVDFSNRGFTISDTLALLEHYDNVFNSKGYTDNTIYTHGNETYYGPGGSVSDYFNDQSYGKFTPTFRIVGPVHPSREYQYYGSGSDANLINLISEICDSVISMGLLDLSEYARNGVIEQLSIIYAGRGENYAGSDPNTIWPQASILNPDRNRASTLYRKGVNTVKYACTCELFWDSDSILDGIGTFCHEFSHTLGLPDFYNTASASESESNSAMGFWSIMDYGNYEDGGFSPVGYTAFEKFSLGWMDIEEIGYAGNFTLQDITHEPDPDADIHSAYRLNTGNDDEFIILENHNRTGWYSYHAAEGLLVTAVSYDNNAWHPDMNKVNSNSRFKRYQVLPADNNYNRNTNAGDPFPYNGKDSITVTGNPQLKAGNSYPSLSVYNIRKKDGVISFSAGPDIISNAPGSLSEEIMLSIADGSLTICAPSGTLVTVHDMSGRSVSETITTGPVQQIALPGQGVWIVKCGNIVRKITSAL